MNGTQAFRAARGLAVVAVLMQPSPAGAVLDKLGVGLRQCAERALPEHTMQQRQRVTVSAPNEGWSRQSVRTMYWRRFDEDELRMLFVVEAPKSEAGLKVLVAQRPDSEAVLHVYTPDTGRARRIMGGGASNSVLGSDLTFEDATHLANFLDAERTTRAADSTLFGRATWVVETMPDDETSAYGRIRTFVDKATCVPVRVEFFGHSGTLDKSLVTRPEDIRRVGERDVPMRTVVTSHKLDSVSEFVLESIEFDIELPDRLFRVSEIRKSR